MKVRTAVGLLAGLTLLQRQKLIETTKDVNELTEKLESGEVPGHGGDASGGIDAGGGFEGFGFFG